MISQLDVGVRRRRSAGEGARDRLLAGIPVTERRLRLAGVSTTVLEGGSGPPVVLSGLSLYRPLPRFGLTLLRFLARPPDAPKRRRARKHPLRMAAARDR